MADVKTLRNPAYPPGRIVNYGVQSNLRLPFRTDTTRAVVKAPIAAVVSAFPADANFSTAPGLSIATRRSSGDDWRINSANLQGAPGTIADALRVQRDQLALEQYTDKYFDVARDNVGPIGPVSSYPTYPQVKLDRDVQYAYPDAQASLNYYPDKLMYRGAALSNLNVGDAALELPKTYPATVPFISSVLWSEIYKGYEKIKIKSEEKEADGTPTAASLLSAGTKGIIDTIWTAYQNTMTNASISAKDKQDAVDQLYTDLSPYLNIRVGNAPAPCLSLNPPGSQRCTNDRCKELWCDASGKDKGGGPEFTLGGGNTPPSTDNTGLYIGLGVGVVALLGAAYFLTKK